jgi:hypothetical protein
MEYAYIPSLMELKLNKMSWCEYEEEAGIHLTK